MSRIEREQVERAAQLARLELSEDEAERFGAQLSAVLEAAAKLQELPIDGVEPSAGPGELRNAFREDVVEQSLPPEAVLQNAPDVSEGHFRVPRIMGGSSDGTV